MKGSIGLKFLSVLFFLLAAVLSSFAFGAVLYRSVGVTATDLNTVSATVIVDSLNSTATFSTALPANIGVGDVLQYDSNNDGLADAIAIITKRISSTQYDVASTSGGSPVSTSGVSVAVSIYRAYVSLAKAAVLDENDNLVDTLEDFDTQTDLVTSGNSYYFVCYADGIDTSPADFSGWITDATNYIRIYTPYHDTEVGKSQRHWGNWASGGYSLEVSTSVALNLNTAHVELEGLRISATGYSAVVVGANGSDIRISSCIIKGDATSDVSGIEIAMTGGQVRIWNNIIYNFKGTGSAKAIDVSLGVGSAYLYNNTVYNVDVGINVGSGTVVAKNNIVQKAGDGYVGTFDSSSDNNITDVSPDPVTGLADAPNATFTGGLANVVFISTVVGSEDLRLASSDTAARDKGADLSADLNLSFTKDVDSLSRYDGNWDIGADEESNNGYVVWDGGGDDSNWSTAANWSNDTVPGVGTKVLFDDWSVKASLWDALGPLQIDTLKVMSDYTGTLTMGRDVEITGDWAYYGANFDPGTYAINFYGATISNFIPGTVTYYNIIHSKSFYGRVDIYGTVHVANDYTIADWGRTNGGTIEISGNLYINSNRSGQKDAATLYKFVGTGNQSLVANGTTAIGSVEVDKASGILSLVGEIHFVGSWVVTNGTVDPGTSTLVLTDSGGGQQLLTYDFTPGAETYYNIVDARTYYRGVSIVGTVKVSNDFTITSISWGRLYGGVIEVAGNVYVNFNKVLGDASTVIELNGTGDQTISSAGGTLGSVEISKPSGVVHLSGFLRIDKDWIWNSADSLDASTSTIDFISSAASNFITGGQQYFNILIEKGFPYTVYQTGDLYAHYFRLTYGNYTTNNYKMVLDQFEHTRAATNFNAGSSVIVIRGGDFIHTAGNFNADTSRVILEGADQRIRGATTTFYDLIKHCSGKCKLIFDAGSSITIGHLLELSGQAGGRYIELRSSIDGSQYSLNVDTVNGAVAKVEYADVKDCYLVNSITAAASIDSGDNANLALTREFICRIRATGGDYTSLSSWATAVGCDLTATTTKVFSHSGIVGTIADGALVTGATSGATGTVVHCTSNQILIKSIVGSFVSGEQVQVDASDYVTITDAGTGAVAAAYVYNDWSSTGLNDVVTISNSSWVADELHFISIYVPISERHDGKVKDGLNYSGFSLVGTGTQLSISVPYTRVEGIIFDDPDGLTNAVSISADHVILSHNIFNGFDGSYYGIIIGANALDQIKNNIFINSNISVSDSATGLIYFYNNTIYGGSLSAGLSGYVLVKNTIGYNATVAPFSGTYNTGSGYNLSNDTSAPGSNSITGVSLAAIAFKDTTSGSEDLHIYRNSEARNKASDLSGQTEAWVVDDIDGTSRVGLAYWDIGVDEANDVVKYRSVGITSTALATDNAGVNLLSISGTTATFSGALPANVGIGDIIQYDSDADGIVDSLAVITKRLSSTQYNVSSIGGELAPTGVTNSALWGVYRAYTSLSSCAALSQNSNITVAQIDSTKNLTYDESIFNIVCYADGIDTSPADFSGWITDSQHYINIYTPVSSDEVGVSQRHTGTWISGGYSLEVATKTALELPCSNVNVNGLKISVGTGDGVNKYCAIDIASTIPSIVIKNCILKSDNSSKLYGIRDETDSYGKISIYNNIVYDFAGNISYGFKFSTHSSVYLYNNTIYNAYDGIDAGSYGVVLAKNDLLQSCSNDGYIGTFDPDSDHNISDISADAPNKGFTPAVGIVSFMDAANRDLRIAGWPDWAAIDKGQDLSSDPYCSFSTDIAGQNREVTAWDIGAYEYQGTTVSSVNSGRWADASVWDSGYVPTPKDNVVISAGNTVTYDVGNLLFDDFEAGALLHSYEGYARGWDFSGPAETGNSRSIVSSPVYYGNYCIKYVFGGVAGSNENYDTALPVSSAYHIRLYFYLESEALTDGNETSVFEVTDNSGTNVVAKVTVYKSGTSVYLKAYYYDDANGLVALPNIALIEPGKWYEVEFYQKASSTGLGEARFYVNGGLIDKLTGLTNGGASMRKFFLGQKNGTNDQAITYYIDEVAIDSGFRNYSRPTNSLDVSKPYHYDYQVKAVTIQAGGELNSDQIDTKAKQCLWPYGNVTISGTLSLNYPFQFCVKSDSSGQYGITVNSGAKFITNGYLKGQPRLSIGAAYSDNSHNTYILCLDGSLAKFYTTEFCYLGTDAAGEYGITAQSLDPASADEGLIVKCSDIHNCYMPIRMETLSNALIYGNSIHDNVYGLYLLNSSNNSISFNDIYSNANAGITLDTSNNNVLYANVLYNNPTAILLTGTSSYNRIYNQTISTSSNYGVDISDLSQTSNQIKNCIIHSCSTGIVDGGTSTVVDYNLFYGNTSDGAVGTNSITGVDPLFISTTVTDSTFMYLAKNSPALGAGIDLFNGTSASEVNMGARLGYVKDITSGNVFNYINGPTLDLSTSAGDTITTYSHNILQSSLIGDGVELGAGFVELPVADDVVVADGDLVGDYIFIEAGENFGYYYPIISSKEGLTDTIVIYAPNHSASTFHTGDRFTVIDRVYGWKRNTVENRSVVLLEQDHANITYNTSGRVVVSSLSDDQAIMARKCINTGLEFVKFYGFVFSGFNLGIGLGENYPSGCFGTIRTPIVDNNIFVGCSTAVLLAFVDWGTNNSRERHGAYILDNFFRDNIKAISYGDYADESVFIDNMFVNNSGYGMYTGLKGDFLLIDRNKFFGNSVGLNDAGFYGGVDDSICHNVFLGNTTGIELKSTDGHKIFNNIFYANNNGLLLSAVITCVNNIFTYNTNALAKAVTTLNITEDFNYYYSNSVNYWNTIGTHSIAGSSDPFKYTDLGAADLASTTTMVYIAGASWKENQFKGYAVKLVNTTTGETYFSGIYSNTTDKLYLSPGLSVEADGLEVYVTDFSLVPGSGPLGQGCRADGSTKPGTVNMGISLGFVKNQTDGTKFNTIQDAAVDANLSPGDVVTTYAVQESSGVVGAVESAGPFTRITLYNSTTPTSEDTITSDDQYDGMYLYFTSGADKGKYYLINECVEMSTSAGDPTDDDMIVIICSDPSKIHTGDNFVIVDRVYNRQEGVIGTETANAVLSIDGSALDPITWEASGNVIIDGRGTATYGIALNGADYQKIIGFDIQNTTSYGFYATGPVTGLVLDNDLVHDAGGGLSVSATISAIEDNQLWNVGTSAVNIDSLSSNVLFSHNKIWTNGGTVLIAAGNSTVVRNQLLGTKLEFDSSNGVLIKNFVYKEPISLGGTGSGNRIWNNSVYKSLTDGIYIGINQTSNILRNNMLVGNTEAGIDDDDATGSNNIDFNLYLANAATYEGVGTRGANEKELLSLALKARASGTVGAGSTSSVIVDTSKAWVTDVLAGMVVKVTDGAGNSYYGSVLSNTASRIYLYMPLSYTPLGDGTESYELYDLSVAGAATTETLTSLGTGCDTDGITSPGTINIGWITDFVENTTDSLKFNSIQDAHDDASLTAGDTVSVYSHDEYSNATIGASITDIGPFVTLEVAEEAVVSFDDQYNGMYLVVKAGENYGRCYLIVDTDERTAAVDGTDVDTITILADDASGFHPGEKFSIVDRVYERIGNCSFAAIAYLYKQGTVGAPISFQSAGDVVLVPGKTRYGLMFNDDPSSTIACAQYLSAKGFYINSAYIGINLSNYYFQGRLKGIRLLNNIIVDSTRGINIDDHTGAIGGGDTFGHHLVMHNVIRNCDFGTYITRHTDVTLLYDNLVFSCKEDGIGLPLDDYVYRIAIFNNKVFGNYSGIDIGRFWPGKHHISIIGNIVLGNSHGADIECISGEPYIIRNNVWIANSSRGISFNNFYYHGYRYVRNNIFAYNNVGVFIGNPDPNITLDYNFYYSNTTDVSGLTKGANAITGYAPGFRAIDLGTVGAGTTASMIVDTTKSWVPNQWQGYGVKVDIGGTIYWAGIYSNTANTLYITPALAVTPTAGVDTYQITDFSINPTTSSTTPLGQGCIADNSTEPGYVNMGSHLEFVQLDNGTKYNSLKAALDAATDGYSASIGSYVYVKSATVKAVVNLGSVTRLDVDDSLVPSYSCYNGMYVVVTHGANVHKAYLIVDTVETDETADNVDDSIYILTDYSAGFAVGDVIDIVDRIYNYDAVDKAVSLKATGLADKQSILSGFDTQYWYAGSSDFENPIDYVLYDSTALGCECTELRNLYGVNYTTFAGGLNLPRQVLDSYFYPCSACYMDLLMRARNYFVKEGVLIKCGITE